MANKELTEAQVEQMETTAREFRAKQAAARDRANAERLITESGTNAKLREFVGSDQYKEFVEAASAIAQTHIGVPLVQHLTGALTSLSVVSAEVANAEQAYTAAEATLAEPAAEPEAKEDNL